MGEQEVAGAAGRGGRTALVGAGLDVPDLLAVELHGDVVEGGGLGALDAGGHRRGVAAAAGVARQGEHHVVDPPYPRAQRAALLLHLLVLPLVLAKQVLQQRPACDHAPTHGN